MNQTPQPEKKIARICKLILFLGLKQEVTQFKWGRKLYGGTWYKIDNWLPMTPFWSDRIINSCGGRVIRKEHYKANEENKRENLH